MKYLYALVIVLCSGCTALKEKTGEYVTEAVTDKIVSEVDKVLERRGLSLSEIKLVADLNADGNLNKQEIVDNVKASAKDFILLEAKNLVDQQIEKNKLVSDGELKGKASEIWNWILALVSAYLGKQIVSAKNDGKRDQRIAVIEKLLNRDIDGDGRVGNGNGNGNGSNPAHSITA